MNKSNITTIDTLELEDEEVRTIRVFVSDSYEESEELTIEITRDDINFSFWVDGDLVGAASFTHQDLFKTLVEKLTV